MPGWLFIESVKGDRGPWVLPRAHGIRKVGGRMLEGDGEMGGMGTGEGEFVIRCGVGGCVCVCGGGK